VRAIAQELTQDGFSILPTASAAEGRIVASTHHGLACILVAAEGAGEQAGAVVEEVTRRSCAPTSPVHTHKTIHQQH
jgi:hypothetical protein